LSGGPSFPRNEDRRRYGWLADGDAGVRTPRRRCGTGEVRRRGGGSVQDRKDAYGYGNTRRRRLSRRDHRDGSLAGGAAAHDDLIIHPTRSRCSFATGRASSTSPRTTTRGWRRDLGHVWGLLFGMLFFIPFLGMAIGAGLGALMGKVTEGAIRSSGRLQRRPRRSRPVDAGRGVAGRHPRSRWGCAALSPRIDDVHQSPADHPRRMRDIKVERHHGDAGDGARRRGVQRRAAAAVVRHRRRGPDLDGSVLDAKSARERPVPAPPGPGMLAAWPTSLRGSIRCGRSPSSC
jgi:hypothetical protein